MGTWTMSHLQDIVATVRLLMVATTWQLHCEVCCYRDCVTLSCIGSTVLQLLRAPINSTWLSRLRRLPRPRFTQLQTVLQRAYNRAPVLKKTMMEFPSSHFLRAQMTTISMGSPSVYRFRDLALSRSQLKHSMKTLTENRLHRLTSFRDGVHRWAGTQKNRLRDWLQLMCLGRLLQPSLTSRLVPGVFLTTSTLMPLMPSWRTSSVRCSRA